jgi:DNA repair protein RecO (recombination protein O)
MSKDVVTVIKSVNYSEADKVLTVFGRELGRFTVFAKGIRKINSKNRGSMQTLCTSKISFYEGRGLPILTESESLYVPDLQSEQFKIENVERILFLLNRFLQEYDPYPRLFDALQVVLDKGLRLEDVNKLRMKFLKEMGFMQDFTVCAECGSQKDLRYLDTKAFALVCKNCYSKGRGKPLGDSPYRSQILTNSLDNYVRRVVDEI